MRENKRKGNKIEGREAGYAPLLSNTTGGNRTIPDDEGETVASQRARDVGLSEDTQPVGNDSPEG